MKEKTANFECLNLRLSACILRTASKVAGKLFVMTAMISLPLFTALLSPERASAQARVDLEDLSVKGELLNDNRMRMTSREATSIQDRVKYRKDFRSEIIDGSDVRVPAAEALDEVQSK